jgi:hypothetical protein
MFALCHSSCTVDTRRVNAALVATGIMLVALPAWAQPRGVKEGEVIEAAPAVAPNIYKATAVKRDGKVMIHISARETRLRNKEPDDKETKDWIDCWTEMAPLVFDEQIRAYKPSGDRINETAILRALAKPVAVACFQRTHKSDPKVPDPFYTGLFRDNVVIFVFEAKYWLR